MPVPALAAPTSFLTFFPQRLTPGDPVGVGEATKVGKGSRAGFLPATVSSSHPFLLLLSPLALLSNSNKASSGGSEFLKFYFIFLEIATYS